MGRYTSIRVMVFLVVMTSPAKAAALMDCEAVISNVLPCSNFLKSPPGLALPGSSCCNAIRKLNDELGGGGGGGGDVNSVCKCIQPIISQFLPPKAQQLPSLCNLNAQFLPLVECLSSPFDDLDGLIPPLPFTLPPPLPFISPAADQKNNLQDGLVPPLPFPLPPTINLPPLPPLHSFPFPPLPFVPPAAANQEKDLIDALLPPLPSNPLPPIPFVPLPFIPPMEGEA